MLGRRQPGDTPSPSEGLNQQDTGVHPSAKNIDVVPFVGKRGRLSVYDLKVVIDAGFISVGT